jgi:hypothetical protein
MPSNEPKTTIDLPQAERWLFDLVSGLASDEHDWQPVAEHCSLLEPLAREITLAVLSDAFIDRVARREIEQMGASGPWERRRLAVKTSSCGAKVAAAHAAQKVLVEGLKQCWEVRSNPEAVERVVFDILAPADRLTAEDLAWAVDRLREIKL